MQRSLRVLIDGDLVGTLAEPRTNKFTFSYDAGTTHTVSERLLHTEDRYPPAAVAPLVDALVPDEARRLELADAHGIPEHLRFRLLEICGADLPGAVTIESDRPADATERIPLTPDLIADEMLVVRHGDQWAIPTSDEPSSHILRFEDDLLPGSIAAEHHALRVADAAGIPTMPAEQIELFGIPALAVQRPDRIVEDDTVVRRHLERFGSVCGVTLDGDDEQIYEENGGPGFSELAEALDRHAADTRAALHDLACRMVAHVCLGNTNAHANTYALLLPERRLAPMDALLPAEIFTELVTDEGTFDIDHRLAMAIGGRKKGGQVTVGALVGEAAAWPRWNRNDAELAIHDAVERLAAAHQRTPTDDAPDQLVTLIDERITRLRTG